MCAAVWGWGVVPGVKGGEYAEISLAGGGLTGALKDRAGSASGDRGVGVYYQEKDGGGKIVRGDRFLDGRTDNTGVISWDITAGNYVVEIQDIATLLDVPIRSGAITVTDGNTITSR